jgi:hypothetical protein
LKRGTNMGDPRGTPWRVSWLLLGACQEVTSKNRHRSARGETAQYDRPKKNPLKH